MIDDAHFVHYQVSECLLTEFNVRQRITAAYHPQSNGQDERSNQTIKRYVGTSSAVFQINMYTEDLPKLHLFVQLLHMHIQMHCEIDERP